ncbi:hypothetical protein F66182_4208 [Fusarium sp. NRRL 66182]|nr:hypothetical protein F66182_4208 [Fusarium sp. NRRL 66182]
MAPLHSALVSTVEIDSSDDIYMLVMSWVARNNRLSGSTHRLLASSTMREREPGYDLTWQTHTQDDEKDCSGVGDTAATLDLDDLSSFNNVQPPHFTPSVGTHFFIYENRILSFTRAYAGRGSDAIMISCLGRDASVLKRLVHDAVAQFLRKQRGRTAIYRALDSFSSFGQGWSRTSHAISIREPGSGTPTGASPTVVAKAAAKEDVEPGEGLSIGMTKAQLNKIGDMEKTFQLMKQLALPIVGPAFGPAVDSVDDPIVDPVVGPVIEEPK